MTEACPGTVADGWSRPRPAFLRALGRAEPPERVLVAAGIFRLDRVFKHDSWAATALYHREGENGGEALVCKFNRQESVFGLPLAWLGPMLARREARFLERLAGTGRVPTVHRQVHDAQGRQLHHAVAHAFVPGAPLSKRSVLSDDFFPCLEQLLGRMHSDGLAYVDLHKMENVLVGPDGLPWLIDFQVSFALPHHQPWRGLVMPLFQLLRSGDTYHLIKHWIRLRPDQCGLGPDDLDRYRPRWIRWHRRIGVPLRSLRRRLLTWLRVRDASGHARSEAFAEEALRDP
jgi:hypothetical protein